MKALPDKPIFWMRAFWINKMLLKYYFYKYTKFNEIMNYIIDIFFDNDLD